MKDLCKNNTCYICQKLIPVSKISSHIEECKIQLANLKKFTDSPFKKIDTCILNRTPLKTEDLSGSKEIRTNESVVTFGKKNNLKELIDGGSGMQSPKNLQNYENCEKEIYINNITNDTTINGTKER